jgi:hypothetical protein
MSRGRRVETGVAMAALAGALIFGLAAPAAAQNEDALRAYFEGKRVTLKIDMPATVYGVDIRPGTARPLDYKVYGDRIKSAGAAIKAGDSVLVTLVHVKDDLIEFQLAGGGFGHETGSVYIPLVEKSNREKDLEKRVKAETDPGRLKALQRELDDLVTARDRENARINRERARLEEQNKARISVERLSAGSRFNLRYDKRVPEGTGPRDVMAALAEYVTFGGGASAAAGPRPVPLPAAISGAQPRKGMLREDAERELGRPVEALDRREGALTVTTLVFIRGDERIRAEFVEGVLFRYSITSK